MTETNSEKKNIPQSQTHKTPNTIRITVEKEKVDITDITGISISGIDID